ncbi:hypothetical protein SUNI508_03739 [Seiridium unicorne]|uniref:Uncharacterized protein n=1 Tax=Seiridium unicorne TaxID=138068 RepID=A0ABR2VBV5_9PEZI
MIQHIAHRKGRELPSLADGTWPFHVSPALAGGRVAVAPACCNVSLCRPCWIKSPLALARNPTSARLEVGWSHELPGSATILAGCGSIDEWEKKLGPTHTSLDLQLSNLALWQ